MEGNAYQSTTGQARGELCFHITLRTNPWNDSCRRVYVRHVSHQQEGHDSSIFHTPSKRQYTYSSGQIHPKHLQRRGRQCLGRRILQLQAHQPNQWRGGSLQYGISDHLHYLQEQGRTLDRDHQWIVQIQQRIQAVSGDKHLCQYGKCNLHLPRR